MTNEPSTLEIILTKIVWRTIGKSVYKDFADRLPLGDDDRILDFGCGMGTVSYFLSKRMKEGHIDCVDQSQKWVKECQKILGHDEHVTIHSLEAYGQLNLNETYDMVFCHFVLHELSDKTLVNTLKDIADLLKPGGYFIYREPLSQGTYLETVTNFATQNQLHLISGRVTDLVLMGNTIERIYLKKER